jgi:phage terminase small subunit
MNKQEQAEKDYMAGMKYKDIAAKYDVSINTVKSWKSRYGWQRSKGATKAKKGVHTKSEKGAHKTVQILTDNEDLNDKQKMFCLYYLQRFNATWAYMKAYDASYVVANTAGPRLLVNVRIKKQLSELKTEMANDLSITAQDVAREYARQAFADIGDYVDFGSIEDAEDGVLDKDGEFHHRHYSYVYLNDKEKVDTSLIKSVHIGKDGVMVELYDKQKAMSELMKYLSNDEVGGEVADDGFIDALNNGAKDVWGDSDETES